MADRHIEGVPLLDMGGAIGGISRALAGGRHADPSTGASESSFDRSVPLGKSLELSLRRVATGVWVEYHRGPTRRQPAG